MMRFKMSSTLRFESRLGYGKYLIIIIKKLYSFCINKEKYILRIGVFLLEDLLSLIAYNTAVYLQSLQLLCTLYIFKFLFLSKMNKSSNFPSYSPSVIDK